jgi:nucleoside-diphosphate-sugar epimerase
MSSYQFSGKKTLVTGASGFIGSHLCRRLADCGAEVHGVSRTRRSPDKTCLHWWQGDLADIATVRDILTSIKPDVIFHLASHVVGARDADVVLSTFNSNLVSTVNLLTVSTELNPHRIVLVGSLEEPDEGAQVAPSSPYAASKWAGSAYARMFHALYQTPVTMARLYMVYGPGQQDLRKLIPYLTLALLRKEAPRLTSGQRQVDWIYVGDVVDGLLAIAKAPDVEGDTIDLGSGVLVPIRTVVQQLVNIIDSDVKPLLGSVPDRPMEQVRVADISNTYDKIGWNPGTSLQEGLQRTVDWYREL